MGLDIQSSLMRVSFFFHMYLLICFRSAEASEEELRQRLALVNMQLTTALENEAVLRRDRDSLQLWKVGVEVGLPELEGPAQVGPVCDATHCDILQHTAAHATRHYRSSEGSRRYHHLVCDATRCNILQHTATHCRSCLVVLCVALLIKCDSHLYVCVCVCMCVCVCVCVRVCVCVCVCV